MLEKVYELSEVFGSDETPRFLRIATLPERDEGYLVLLDLDSMKYENLKFFQTKAVGKKLLYVKFTGNISTWPCPTINLQGDEKNEKNDKESLNKVLERFVNFFNHELTTPIYKTLRDNYDSIYTDLLKIPPKDRKRSVLSIGVIEDGSEKLPADHRGISSVFLERFFEHKERGRIGCFMCGKPVESYPQMNKAFKFATFDKPAFTPGLRGKAAGGSVLSICDDCLAKLIEGRNIVEERLSFRFFGDTLWVIPSGPEKTLERFARDLEKTDIFKRGELRNFAKTERGLEKRLGETENLDYDFVVLSISKNEEKLLLHVSEIPPSRFRKIVETSEEFKSDPYSVDPTLAILAQMYKSPKSREFGKTDFYKLVRSIYSGREYSKNVFLSYVMRWIRSQLMGSDILKNLKYVGSNAFFSYIYLIRLGVIQGGDRVQGESFFEKYSDFFDHPWKKAVFLIGVLSGYMINYQSVTRGGTPFVKKFKGLKMRKEDVQSLLSEIKSKMMQYKLESASLDSLLENASRYMIEAGDWKAGVDEINFVFTVGMSMFRRFTGGVEYEEE